jgi:hypothetical protein
MSLVGPTFGPETYRSNRGSGAGRTQPKVEAPAGPQVSGNSNDQTQKLVNVGNGVFALDGKALNRGVAGSKLTMDIDGHQVSVGMSGGQSPKKTLDLLEGKLPAGYALERLESPAQFPGSARFRIVKDGAQSTQSSRSVEVDDAPAPRSTRRESYGDSGYGGFGGGFGGGGCWGTGRGGMGY